MLGLVILFLLVALLAHFLGSEKVSDVALKIAIGCAIVFVILLILSFAAPGTNYWGWPGR